MKDSLFRYDQKLTVFLKIFLICSSILFLIFLVVSVKNQFEYLVNEDVWNDYYFYYLFLYSFIYFVFISLFLLFSKSIKNSKYLLIFLLFAIINLFLLFVIINFVTISYLWNFLFLFLGILILYFSFKCLKYNGKVRKLKVESNFLFLLKYFLIFSYILFLVGIYIYQLFNFDSSFIVMSFFVFVLSTILTLYFGKMVLVDIEFKNFLLFIILLYLVSAFFLFVYGMFYFFLPFIFIPCFLLCLFFEILMLKSNNK